MMWLIEKYYFYYHKSRKCSLLIKIICKNSPVSFWNLVPLKSSSSAKFVPLLTLHQGCYFPFLSNPHSPQGQEYQEKGDYSRLSYFPCPSFLFLLEKRLSASRPLLSSKVQTVTSGEWGNAERNNSAQWDRGPVPLGWHAYLMIWYMSLGSITGSRSSPRWRMVAGISMWTQSGWNPESQCQNLSPWALPQFFL